MSMSNKGNSAHPRNSEYLRDLDNVDAQAPESEGGEGKVIRREFSLSVPDDGPNYLTLPGGIRPGSKFKMEREGTNVRTVKMPEKYELWSFIRWQIKRVWWRLISIHGGRD